MAKAAKVNLATTSHASHPGKYVRDVVLIPKKLSVVAAAKLVGVGRPALSNFLNGHVATTSEMASRIEVAFGIPAQNLLDMQVAYEVAQTKLKSIPINAMPYVAPFLGIKATEIETWVTRNIAARTRLSVFLRTLVNSTASSITRIDFPGNDDAERPGWDGFIECSQPTPWIPEGQSGWEFGTNQDIKTKADGDFAKSVKATAKDDRTQTTFVFVTPRHWSGKADWVKANKVKDYWKDVRAYDASDLEQWLEQSVAAQAWFASEIDRPSKGVRSLDKCWDEWANVANPPLIGSLFSPAIESAKRTMLSRLSRAPDGPTVIAADSVEEALAFLAQILGPLGGEELERYRERVLVFKESGVLPKLAQGTTGFIAVAANHQIEHELGAFTHSMHSIVIYPRNAANTNPHVTLEPLNYDAFRSSLEEMGLNRDDITKLNNESGRSLTVLRRRMSSTPAIKTPSWATDHKTARQLIPYMLSGAWNATNQADQVVLATLAKANSYEEIETTCQGLVALNDPPLWSVGLYRGVISKIDLLFAIASSVTTQDLDRYFEMAKKVLGEDDPKLDLPEGDRWAAAIHGKSRQFSSGMRDGISETLILLAVHGNDLFQNRLGFDCAAAVARLVRELLTPLKMRILEANDKDLASYAEAAPDVFLSILEDDLRLDHPESYGLMRPVKTGGFGDSCARSGLLWALEGLAWSPTTLPRTVLILAQLAEIEIIDNWVNKPMHSLESIFRIWMPQTAANHDTRLRILKNLEDKFPKIAWKICISQFGTGHETGDYSHKPRWRNDAYGFGEPFKTWEPINKFRCEVIEMAINWKKGHERDMLCDLISRLSSLSEEHQANVWALVNSWASVDTSNTDKAFLREKIRVTIMSRRRARLSKEKTSTKLLQMAKVAYQALEPSDLLCKHEWLFRENWVEESADELHDDDMDFEKREERITKLRIEALREIFKTLGLQGIFDLAAMGNAAHQIGRLVVTSLLPAQDIPSFLTAAQPVKNSSNNQHESQKNIIAGALRAFDNESLRTIVLMSVKNELLEENFTQILLLAPFRRSTWEMIDKLDENNRQAYWDNVLPNYIFNAEDENSEAVERLLSVQRPRAAFAAIHIKFEVIRPELLFRLMSEMVKKGNDQPGHYPMQQYYVEQAFVHLDKSPILTLEQKAGLELSYIEALSKPWSARDGYGIPNLEKYVEMNPELFVWAVVWTYKRADDGLDPPEWKVDPGHTQQNAERGYKLLEGLTRIPGYDSQGHLQTDRLSSWIKVVRDACAKVGRLDIGDICLGKLLSTAPIGSDGIWPCEPVRQVMEDVHSKSMMSGAHTGLYNSRGATWRGSGGGQERALADKYRPWANELQYSHPFVASHLLMNMVKTYEHEANREDLDAGIRKRMH
jgi:addiction module HigA family antidote